MATKRVEDLRANERDDSGNEVVCVYTKNPPDYGVYRNRMRVMVQFGDDKTKARRQRSRIAALSPLRGQISGLIDGWHDSPNPGKKARAERYDRRVADAVVIGLEGDIAESLALLTEVRDDIVAERKSLAQTDYLLWAAGGGLALLALAGLLSLFPFDLIPDSVWIGAGGGTVGAFFSIAIGLRTRTILVDLQKWDNRRDAILRIAVGTIGGAILICLLLTGIVSFAGIETMPAPRGAEFASPLMALVVGFIAGFSERAVPDLLAKASLATDTSAGDSTDVAGDKARAAAVAPPAAEWRDEDAADEESGETDACLCDAPPVPGEILTEDKDLPPATGGVEGEQGQSEQDEESEADRDPRKKEGGA